MHREITPILQSTVQNIIVHYKIGFVNKTLCKHDTNFVKHDTKHFLNTKTQIEAVHIDKS